MRNECWRSQPTRISHSPYGHEPARVRVGVRRGRAQRAHRERRFAMADPTNDTTTDTRIDQPAPVDEIAEESLVEEVSIDGMCGVY